MTLISYLPTPLRTYRGRLAGVAVALLLLGGIVAWSSAEGAHPVAAAQPVPPEPAASERFALTPTGADPSQPGSRTTFGFTQAPGATTSDRVTLFNYADHPTAFQLYANDAFDTAEGQLDLKRSDQKPTDAGAWVKLQQGALVVPANSATVVPFVVIAPRGASPGDHAAGIIASVKSTATTPTGQTVDVEHRIGVPLYVRINGPLHPGLAVVDVQSHYHRGPTTLGGGTLDVSYRVANVGNVRLAGHQKIEVQGPLGFVLKRQNRPDLPELLPGASVAGHAHFTGVLPTLRVTTVVIVHPFSKQGALHPAPRTVRGSSTVWAIPWTWLLVAVIIVGLGFWRYRVRRRRRPAPPAATPAPVLAGSAER